MMLNSGIAVKCSDIARQLFELRRLQRPVCIHRQSTMAAIVYGIAAMATMPVQHFCIMDGEGHNEMPLILLPELPLYSHTCVRAPKAKIKPKRNACGSGFEPVTP